MARNADLHFRYISPARRDKYMRRAWKGKAILSWYEKSTFDKLKTNLFMLTVLHEEGGYWIDAHRSLQEPIINLHDPDDEACLVISEDFSLIADIPTHAYETQLTHHNLSTWFLGFVPRHNLLATSIESFLEIAPYFDRHSVWSLGRATQALAGGGLLTRSLRQAMRNQSKLNGIRFSTRNG
jgi:hypothetical protein